MEFKEFAHKLFSIIGAGNNTKRFTRTLFESILDEENSEIIDGSLETFKAYYNGNTKISKLSQKILIYIKPECFVDYLNEFSDDVIDALCDTFRDMYPDINKENAAVKLSELFADIIKKAASTAKKASSSPKSKEVKAIILPESNAANNSCSYKHLSDSDSLLLQEFTADYDEIVLKCIGNNFAVFWLDMTIPSAISSLYESKWKTKAENFENLSLKPHIWGMLSQLNELCSVLDNEKKVGVQPSVRSIREKLRNLYVKLHPSNYANVFLYDAVMDDWSYGEDY